jgi:hypothetical protein
MEGGEDGLRVDQIKSYHPANESVQKSELQAEGLSSILI